MMIMKKYNEEERIMRRRERKKKKRKRKGKKKKTRTGIVSFCQYYLVSWALALAPR